MISAKTFIITIICVHFDVQLLGVPPSLGVGYPVKIQAWEGGWGCNLRICIIGLTKIFSNICNIIISQTSKLAFILKV